MGVALGLAAALGLGTADFLARYAIQRIGFYRSLLFMQVFGLVALSVYLLASGELRHLLTTTAWQPWAWAIGVAVIETASALALYRAFEVGVLSIVSPVAASFGVVSVVLSVLSGELLSHMRATGIAAALAGVVLASHTSTPGQKHLAPAEHTVLPRGVGWAIASSVGFGITFWLLGFHVTPSLGSVAPIWIVRLVTPCALVLASSPLRQTIQLPQADVRWLLAAIGVLDTAGLLAATMGLRTDQVSVVSVLASLFSAVTVLLAWTFLRERLHRIQWFGIVLILFGVALVSA